MPGILIPPLGYATHEATLLAWLRHPGDAVAKDDPLAELAMEKTVHVLVAEQAGVLLATWAEPGAILPEGESLGWIGAAGETAPAYTPRLVGWEPEIAPPPPDLAARMTAHPAPSAPAALHAEAPSATAPATPTAFSAQHRGVLRHQLRRVTAQRMARSWVDAPKVDLFAEVDFTRTIAHREALKADGEEAPSYNVYIAHAAAKAFRDLPEFNFHLRHGAPQPLDGIHVGMAVALGDNLVTVSLRHLEEAGLMDVQRQFKGLIRKALRLSLTRDELYGSSLTVTNLGEYDVSAFSAIINPPETFILAIGAIEPRAVVRDGAVTAATCCTFCLSFDHKAVDGAPASRLLQRIKQHMEGEPGPL